jgi:hypothetical protein
MPLAFVDMIKHIQKSIANLGYRDPLHINSFYLEKTKICSQMLCPWAMPPGLEKLVSVYRNFYLYLENLVLIMVAIRISQFFFTLFF